MVKSTHDPQRVFSWLICETRDAKGNAIVYEYKGEDGAGVDLNQIHGCNRGGLDSPARGGNCYLKKLMLRNHV